MRSVPEVALSICFLLPDLLGGGVAVVEDSVIFRFDGDDEEALILEECDALLGLGEEHMSNMEDVFAEERFNDDPPEWE